MAISPPSQKHGMVEDARYQDKHGKVLTSLT